MMTSSFLRRTWAVLASVSSLLCFAPNTSMAQKMDLGTTPKLYIGMDDYGSQARSFFQQHQVNMNVKLIYEGSIDPQRRQQVNEDSLRAAITRAFPDANASGIGVLDIESKPYETMRKSAAATPEFASAVNDYFIKAIQIAKATRPNVYWGFYGLPYNNYGRASASSWDATCQKLLPVFQAADIIFPSLYERTSAVFGGSDLNGGNGDHVQDFMKHILTLADQLHKPVMPFVWHRWHPSSARDANKVIPENEFEKYLQYIVQAGKQSKQFKGVVWWGADVYLYKYHKDQLGDDEVQQSSFTTYHDSLLIKYGQHALNALKQ